METPEIPIRETVLVYSELDRGPVKVPLVDERGWGDMLAKITRVTDCYSWMEEGVIQMDLRPEVEKLVVNGVRVR